MKFNVTGEPFSVVICDLEAGESIMCEAGAMSWMSPNMKMETTSNGGVGKMFGRMFTGEAAFQNRYTAQGGPGQIAFAASFPGSIRRVEVGPGNEMIVQKKGFLCGETGVNLSVHFQKKVGAGFFGGEGFVMQKLSGNGTAFIEIDGHACEYELGPNDQMIVDTGYLAAMSGTCSIDVATVGSAKNAFFGGEGIFNTVVKGPGKVILQTMPIPSLAGVLAEYFPNSK